jgi:alpha-beta hydrolase superfamily lysophospholipase
MLAVAQVSAQDLPVRHHGRIQRLPLTKFYDDPQPFSPGKPGELIRSEPADDYDLAADFSAFRILYHSRAAGGRDVAASGVVLVPDGKPPAGGWPVLAWAHGFAAAARQCAPSLLRNLYYGPLLSMYVHLGYAVVATDYAGLGTQSRSAVMDIPSNAADVVNSIPAARAAIPQLGAKWIAVGSSLGANVAVGVAERERRTRDPNYLGSIAISGLADMKGLFADQAKAMPFRTLALLAYGIKTVSPDFDANDMLAKNSVPVYNQMIESCDSLSSSSQLSNTEMLKPKWQSNRFVEEFFTRNALGETPAYGPLLVIADDQDPAVPSSMASQAVARMCRQGDAVQFEMFSDPQAGMVLGDSVRDQMAWIEARFAGRPATTNCH